MIEAPAQNGLRVAMVHELLVILAGSVSKSLLSSFRTTADHVAHCIGMPREELTVNHLVDVAPAFRGYLEERRYKRNSVRSYIKFAQLLLARAKDLGWTPSQPEIPEPWKRIFEEAKKAGVKGIVRYAIRKRIGPTDFTDRDLDAWGEGLITQGRSLGTVHYYKRIFKRVLRDAGLSDSLPKLASVPPPHGYSVPLRHLPTQLRDEVEHLLAWKQAPFVPNRPHRNRMRPVTAEGLKYCMQQLYGFAIHIEPTVPKHGGSQGTRQPAINSLVDLITQERITRWVEWRMNDRKALNATVKGDIAMLRGAVRYYPPFAGRDLGWLSALFGQIPPDPRSGIEERKARKFISYGVAAGIPGKIHDERTKLAEGEHKARAVLVRNELLMRWLTVLPWRQRNLRECRLEDNLFKRELPALGGIEVPARIKKQIDLNPRATFWQFDFREEGTKNGERSRGIVPHQLTPLLEEYIQQHRPFLLNGIDPGNLFVSAQGKCLDGESLRELVSDLTYRYSAKRVTPHIFRDIFAYQWLQDRPTDYLTLSKHLWHKDVSTTLNRYGSKFDTSRAACSVEEWLDKRT